MKRNEHTEEDRAKERQRKNMKRTVMDTEKKAIQRDSDRINKKQKRLVQTKEDRAKERQRKTMTRAVMDTEKKASYQAKNRENKHITRNARTTIEMENSRAQDRLRKRKERTEQSYEQHLLENETKKARIAQHRLSLPIAQQILNKHMDKVRKLNERQRLDADRHHAFSPEELNQINEKKRTQYQQQTLRKFQDKYYTDEEIMAINASHDLKPPTQDVLNKIRHESARKLNGMHEIVCLVCDALTPEYSTQTLPIAVWPHDQMEQRLCIPNHLNNQAIQDYYNVKLLVVQMYLSKI